MLFIKRLFEKLIVSVTIFIEKNLSFLKNQRVHLILTHLQKIIAQTSTDAPFLQTTKNKSIEECKVPRKGKWGILTLCDGVLPVC